MARDHFPVVGDCVREMAAQARQPWPSHALGAGHGRSGSALVSTGAGHSSCMLPCTETRWGELSFCTFLGGSVLSASGGVTSALPSLWGMATPWSSVQVMGGPRAQSAITPTSAASALTLDGLVFNPVIIIAVLVLFCF